MVHPCVASALGVPPGVWPTDTIENKSMEIINTINTDFKRKIRSTVQSLPWISTGSHSKTLRHVRQAKQRDARLRDELELRHLRTRVAELEHRPQYVTVEVEKIVEVPKESADEMVGMYTAEETVAYAHRKCESLSSQMDERITEINNFHEEKIHDMQEQISDLKNLLNGIYSQDAPMDFEADFQDQDSLCDPRTADYEATIQELEDKILSSQDAQILAEEALIEETSARLCAKYEAEMMELSEGHRSEMQRLTDAWEERLMTKFSGMLTEDEASSKTGEQRADLFEQFERHTLNERKKQEAIVFKYETRLAEMHEEKAAVINKYEVRFEKMSSQYQAMVTNLKEQLVVALKDPGKEISTKVKKSKK